MCLHKVVVGGVMFATAVASAETFSVAATQNCALSDIITPDEIAAIKANAYDAVEITGAFEVTNDVSFAGFTGTWTQNNNYVMVTSPDAFGAGDVFFTSKSGEARFLTSDGVWANNFTFSGGILRACDQNTFNGTVSCTANGFKVYRTKSNEALNGTGHLIFNGPFVMKSKCTVYPGNAGGNRYIYFNGPVTTTELNGDTTGNYHGTCYLYNPSNNIGVVYAFYSNIALERENVATNSVLTAGYDENNSRSWFYINANQTIDRIGISHVNYIKTGTGSKNAHSIQMSNNAVITMNATQSTVLDHRFIGTGSIVWSPVVPDCTVTFSATWQVGEETFHSSRINTIDGMLKTENGKMEVLHDTSFDNLTSVEVGDNGEFVWESSKGLPKVTKIMMGNNAKFTWNTATGRFVDLTQIKMGENSIFDIGEVSPFAEGTVRLEMGANSKICVPKGVKIVLYTALVDDELLDGGVYQNCDWIEGEGQIEVLGVEPDTIDAVWDAEGGEDDKFSTAANWQGDVVPELRDGSAQIKFLEGTQATLDSAARVKGLSFDGVGEAGFNLLASTPQDRLLLGSLGLSVVGTGVLSITSAVPIVVTKPQTWDIGGENAQVTMEMTTPINSNNDSQFAITRSGKGKLVLRGEGSTWPGSFVHTDGIVEIYGSNTLGVASNDGTAQIQAVADTGKYISFRSGVISKPVEINVMKDIRYVLFNGDASGKIIFKDKVKIYNSTSRSGIAGGSHVVFEGGFECESYMAMSGSEANPSTSSLTFTNTPAVVTGSWQFEARPSLYFCVSSNKWNTFNASYVNDVRVYCRAPWAFYEGNTSVNCANMGNISVDLGGYPQRFGDVVSTKVGSSNMFTNSEERAAQLYLNVKNDYGAWECDFVGNIDLIKEGEALATIGRAVSAKGKVEVVAGTLAFADDASWLGATNVICGANGKLQIATGETFGRHTDVYLATGAELILDNPTAQDVQYLFIDGVRQPKTVYTKANCALISGDGALNVRGDGKGSCILVR